MLYYPLFGITNHNVNIAKGMDKLMPNAILIL